MVYRAGNLFLTMGENSPFACSMLGGSLDFFVFWGVIKKLQDFNNISYEICN